MNFLEEYAMSRSNADVRLAVLKAIRSAEKTSIVLNAYQVAENILETLPQCDMRAEDIVDMMVEMRGSIQAFEFSPPAAIIEIESQPKNETYTGSREPNGREVKFPARH